MRDFAREAIMTAQLGLLLEQAENTPARSVERRIANKCTTAAVHMGSRKRSSEFERLGPREASKLAVEGMHTIQGVGKNVHGLINGHTDGANVRAHEKSIDRFPGCYPGENGRLPPAPFTLDQRSKEVADERLSAIHVPTGKGTLPNNAFAKFHSMKSHTWHMVLLKGVYLFTLRGLLGKNQRLALAQFCYILAICASKIVYNDLMPRIENNYHHCVSIMDREFPETLKTILWHMLRHFPQFVKSHGPLKSYWMFYFERQIHHHVVRMHNNKHPEASMVNAHRIDVLCSIQFYSQEDVCTARSVVSSKLTDRDHVALRRKYLAMYPEEGINFHHQKRSSSSICTETIIPTKDVQKWFSHDGDCCVWKGEEKWRTKGSIVSRRDPVTKRACFGRVQFFFEHNYLGRDHTFVSVNWFEFPQEDEESMLYICQPDSSHLYLNSCTFIDDISDPLIVAPSNEGLFILDFMDKTRCEEILAWIERTC